MAFKAARAEMASLKAVVMCAVIKKTEAEKKVAKVREEA